MSARWVILGLLLVTGCYGAEGATYTPSTSAQAILQGYYPDRKPGTPNALDDEFDDGTFTVVPLTPTPAPNEWVLFDPGSNAPTTSESGTLLTVSDAPVAATSIFGWYKLLPAGDFTIVLKWFASTTTDTDNASIGPCLLQNAADATRRIITIQTIFHDYSGTFSSVGLASVTYVRNYVDYLNTGGAPGNLTVSGTVNLNAGYDEGYFRIRRSGTAIFFEVSRLGGTFLEIGYTTHAATFAPNAMGMCFHNHTQGATAPERDTYFYLDFFRYKASNDVGPIGLW